MMKVMHEQDENAMKPKKSIISKVSFTDLVSEPIILSQF
jgi:hypothetical protein